MNPWQSLSPGLLGTCQSVFWGVRQELMLPTLPWGRTESKELCAKPVLNSTRGGWNSAHPPFCPRGVGGMLTATTSPSWLQTHRGGLWGWAGAAAPGRNEIGTTQGDFTCLELSKMFLIL